MLCVGSNTVSSCLVIFYSVFRLIITARLVRVLLFIRIVTGKDQLERATRRMVSRLKFTKLKKIPGRNQRDFCSGYFIKGQAPGKLISCRNDSSQGKVFHQEDNLKIETPVFVCHLLFCLYYTTKHAWVHWPAGPARYVLIVTKAYNKMVKKYFK